MTLAFFETSKNDSVSNVDGKANLDDLRNAYVP